MDHHWLQKYPKAAAMLQGDDDVLLYETQSGHGQEDRPRGAPAAPPLTLLEPYCRLHVTVRHEIVEPINVFAALLDPTGHPLCPWCDTLLDERMWDPDGQPCPCGRVRWYEEPPAACDRGDW